jgi:hypothetical protein
LSAGLLIAANAVCGGKTTSPSSITFNYGEFNFTDIEIWSILIFFIF